MKIENKNGLLLFKKANTEINIFDKWKQLSEEEKKAMYEYWEYEVELRGENWEQEYSQLKIDELFDILGGEEYFEELLAGRLRNQDDQVGVKENMDKTIIKEESLNKESKNIINGYYKVWDKQFYDTIIYIVDNDINNYKDEEQYEIGEYYDLNNVEDVKILSEIINHENIEVVDIINKPDELINKILQEFTIDEDDKSEIKSRIEWTGKGVYVIWGREYLEEWRIVKADVCLETEIDAWNDFHENQGIQQDGESHRNHSAGLNKQADNLKDATLNELESDALYEMLNLAGDTMKGRQTLCSMAKFIYGKFYPELSKLKPAIINIIAGWAEGADNARNRFIDEIELVNEGDNMRDAPTEELQNQELDNFDDESHEVSLNKKAEETDEEGYPSKTKAEELMESYINGNISWVREQIGNDIKLYTEVLELIESFSPQEAKIFMRRMTASLNKQAIGEQLQKLAEEVVKATYKDIQASIDAGVDEATAITEITQHYLDETYEMEDINDFSQEAIAEFNALIESGIREHLKKKEASLNKKAGIDNDANYAVYFDYWGDEPNKFSAGADFFDSEIQDAGGGIKYFDIERWIPGFALKDFLKQLESDSSIGDIIHIRNIDTKEEYDDWSEIRQKLLNESEIKANLKEASDQSDKPPKDWWDKMHKKVKEGNPSYSEEQVNKTIGDIWYHQIGKGKQKTLRGREGKELKSELNSDNKDQVLIKQSEHEGWKNQATWAIAMFIDNNKEQLNNVLENIQGMDRAGIWDYLETMIDGIVESSNTQNQSTLLTDLINSSLNDVAWGELADHYINKLKDVNQNVNE